MQRRKPLSRRKNGTWKKKSGGPMRRNQKITDDQIRRTVRLARLKSQFLAEIGKCQRCGKGWRDAWLGMDLHHKRSRSRGGTDQPDNLVLLCRECHSLVEDRACPDWRDFIITGKRWESREELRRRFREHGVQDA
jgi:5-methylcytosine-specific restriction endonuclease McrA